MRTFALNKTGPETLQVQPKSHDADPFYKAMLAHVAKEPVNNKEILDRFMGQSQDYETTWKKLQSLKNEKISNVPIATMLGWHIQDIIKEDRRQAGIDFKKAQDALTPEE